MPMKHVEVERIDFHANGVTVAFKLTHKCLIGVTVCVTVDDKGDLTEAICAAQLRLRTALEETADGIKIGPLSLSNMP